MRLTLRSTRIPPTPLELVSPITFPSGVLLSTYKVLGPLQA